MIRYLNLLKISVVFLGIFLIMSSAIPITADNEHEEDHLEIDISSGYTSADIILEWNETKTFAFEITTASAEYTFEILDLNGSLFEYMFDHEHEENHSNLFPQLSISSEGHDDSEDEEYWMTHDGLPMGTHLDGDVLRHVSFTEAGNYSVTLSNAHDHQEDTVKFKVKFSEEHVGVEKMGASWFDDGQSATPGFEIAVLIPILLLSPILIKKKR